MTGILGPQAQTRRSSFSVGFFSGVGGQALYVLLSFPATILVARVLGPDGKGALSLALLVPTLIVTFANLGLGPAGLYLVGARKFPTRDVISTLVGSSLVLAAVLIPAYSYAAWSGWLNSLYPSVSRHLFLLSGLLLPVLLVRFYLTPVLLGQQRFVLANLPPVIQSGAYLLGLLLVWGLALGTTGAVTAAVAGQLLVVFYLLVVLARSDTVRPGFQGPVLQAALSYGLRGHIGNLMQFLNYRLDILILGYIAGVRAVGFYTIAITLAEIVWYIPNASANVVFPRTAAFQEEAQSFTPLVFRLSGALAFGTSLIVAVVAQPLITGLFGAEFQSSLLPLFLLLPGAVCLGAAKVLSADLSGRGLPHYNAIGALISLIFTITLDLILIPSYGAAGAALASSAAYFVTLLYTFVVYARIVRAQYWSLLRFGAADFLALRQTMSRLMGVLRLR